MAQKDFHVHRLGKHHIERQSGTKRSRALNSAAMAQAVRYRFDLGHRQVAMLAGVTQDNDRAAGRLEGARRALRDLGVSLPANRVVERKYSIVAAREGFRELIGVRPAPTAILCGNDVLAFGALFEAQRLGIDVPGTLSIIGFDDLELSSHLNPGLTTIRVPTMDSSGQAMPTPASKAGQHRGAVIGHDRAVRFDCEVAALVRILMITLRGCCALVRVQPG
jgi:DNA-binding LacI/PurR family transcriptional regulator